MEKNKTTHLMTGVLMVGFVCMFLILTGRFLYIQVTGEVNDVSLEEWAKEKRSSSYILDAERGTIFDNNGVTLAYDRRTYRMYAIVDETFTINSKDPKHVVDIEKTAQALAPIIEVEESYIRDRLASGIDDGRVQVEFGVAGRQLSIQTKEEIDALDLPGINFFEESIRYYPNGLFASHILGFARKEESEEDDEDERSENITGVIGIEKELDEVLRGESGYISYQRDYYKKKLLDPNEVIKQPVNGDNVYLTIDQKVQILLEDVMSEVEDEYNPERITAMVMNAKTGAIIAMSNRPSFNPNDPKDVQNWYNDLISTPFEPGSTVKMFTWAAAIDAGVYDGEEIYQSGKYQVNPAVESVNDHNHGRGWGKISFDEGFRRSSNVAASKLVWDKLGPDKYLEYLQAFDFDKKTNIDLPGEVTGHLLYNWPIEKLTTSFGQGTTLTPIQQMKAATAIANDGKMLQPYVVQKVIDSDTDEVIMEHDKTVVSEPISKEAANQVLDLLGTVVNSKDGTGKPYRLDAYSVAGKTGTAQMPDPNGGYLSGRENNIFSFLGMAPQDDPQLMMYVSVTQPTLAEDEVGSDPVSFIFKNVMENSLHYLNIEPDKETIDPVDLIEIPKLKDAQPKAIQETLEAEGLDVTVVGSGKKIVTANVNTGDQVLDHQRIILVTDQPEMPNIIGWSIREVYQLADLLELKLETIGNGYVMTQNIKKGTPLKKNDYLGVELELPNEKNNDEDDDDD
ncbi:MAG TPA: penicillin-binding transpeptidase domain-containing protein [Virgibacillus sp.]|nr:penicillin-binding transpeptidase domain-containing protein [Virgibacillus sp.]